MNLEQMIASARARTGDIRTPQLWSDEEWAEYATQAQQEACRRARLILDSTTEEICVIELNSTDKVYPLDERVIFIKRVKVNGISTPLGRVSFEDLDRCNGGWEEEVGEPRAYVPDMDEDKFRPYPAPDGDYTARLTVLRTPLQDLEDGADVPEIKSRYHQGLINWMLHRAYSKQDSDGFDADKAANALALFENEFGKKSTANEETWINREHGFTPDEGVY